MRGGARTRNPESFGLVAFLAAALPLFLRWLITGRSQEATT